MANVQKKNIIYIDSTGTITVDALKPQVYGVLITPSTDESELVIKESVSGTIAIHIKILLTESRFLDLMHMGIELTSAFEVVTLTNISSVLLYGSWYQPIGRARG